jgi:hypothetical protein
MEGSITWQHVMVFIAAAGALLALWARLEVIVTSLREENRRTRDELIAHKVHVAQEYARNGYIREVEDRVIKRIGEVVSEIHSLRMEINNAVNRLVAAAGNKGQH